MTPPLTLRSADTHDIPALARQWHDGWQEAHAAIMSRRLAAFRDLPSFESELEQRLAEVTVATRQDLILGLLMVRGDELDQLYSSPASRGSGAAQALMARAEQLFRRGGTARAHLLCAINDHRAARFYRKTGWRFTGSVTESLETLDGPFPLTVWRFEKDIPAGR